MSFEECQHTQLTSLLGRLLTADKSLDILRKPPTGGSSMWGQACFFRATSVNSPDGLDLTCPCTHSLSDMTHFIHEHGRHDRRRHAWRVVPPQAGFN